MASYDPLNGLRDAQGGYGTPKKKNPYLTGADTGRDAQGGYTTSGLPGYAATTTIPGFTPDYASLINNDPNYKQLQSDLAAQGIGDLGSRNAQINRALIGFGQVPDINAASKSLGFDLNGAIDAQTSAAAGNNPYSVQANLSDAHTKAIHQIRAALAARGGLQSGELGYQLGNENQAYGQSQYDQSQKLLDYLAGVQAAFAQSEKDRQGQLTQGRRDAATFESSLPQNQPTGEKTATLDQALSEQAGKPIYRAPDGTLHNLDGSVFSPSQSESTPPASQWEVRGGWRMPSDPSTFLDPLSGL